LRTDPDRILTPELRFQPFEDTWSVYRLGDVVDHFKSGSGITSDKIQTEGPFPVYGGNGLRGFTDAFTHDDDLFLIGRQGALCGNINRTTGKAFISEHAIAVKGSNLSDTEWLAQRLDYFGLNRLSESSAQPGLSVKKLARLKLAFPSLPEQQKIADFLSSVDKRISQLTEKKALLEEYKKGVMQKLFSQEIRFKDDNGEDFPEWERVNLGNACSFIKDGTHGTHPNDDESHYLLLSAKNIQNGKIEHDDSDRRISKSEYDSIYKNYGLTEGDLLLTVVGTIGRVAIFKGDEKIAFQRSVAFLRFEDDLPEFMSHQFLASEFQKELSRRKVTSAQPGIYLGDIAKIEVHRPCIREQSIIADFLSSINQQMELIAAQVKETHSFKQGLLQQMFV